MFIPVGADATVYHQAWATRAIIGANVLLFLFIDPFLHPSEAMLEFGALKPWQWITCTFSHAGVLHVGMNMIFLFWFGSLVEGRIGTPRFVLIYLGIASIAGFLTQLLMIGAEDGWALGASGVIFGLMTVALVFARGVNFRVLWWFFSASRVVDISLRGLVVFYLLTNLAWAAIFGFGISSEVLHLIGALGGVAAVFLIREFDWWYEPPEDEIAGDVREEPVIKPQVSAPGESIKPPAREDLPPLELD